MRWLLFATIWLVLPACRTQPYDPAVPGGLPAPGGADMIASSVDLARSVDLASACVQVLACLIRRPDYRCDASVSSMELVDADGQPPGSCNACLRNVLAPLSGAPCDPADDPACRAHVCDARFAACHAS
jgi:hypothetical protein